MATKETDELPDEAELDDIVDDMPPPDSTAPFVADAPTGETAQQRTQHEAAMQREGSDRSVEELEARVGDFVKANPGGYLRVQRVGPIEVPRTEFGDIGKITVRELEAGGRDLNELVRVMGGGGEYLLTFFTGRGRPLTFDPLHLSLSGDFKARSREGKDYLKWKAPEEGPSGGANDALRQVLDQNARLMDQMTAATAKPVGDGGMAAVMQMFVGMQTSMMTTVLAAMKDSQSAALESIRRQTEEARLDRVSADAEAARKHELSIKALDAKAVTDAAAATSGRKYDFLWAKAQLELNLEQRKLELAGPLGVEGHTLLQSRLTESLVDKVMEKYGLDADPEERGGFGQQLLSNIVGPLMEKHGDKALGIIDRWLSGKSNPAARGLPGAPPPNAGAAGAPAALPGPAGAPSADASTVDVSEAPAAPPDAADAPPSPEAPNAEAEVAEAAKLIAANQKTAIRRVVDFCKAVFREMCCDTMPDKAWDTDAVEGDHTTSVADLYERLSGMYQQTLAQGWSQFSASVPAECAVPLKLIARAAENPAAREWLEKFLATGPWHDPEDEDELDDGT